MGRDILFGEAWRPGIGDPTFMGWFTVFAYLVVAFFAFRRMFRERRADMCCWRAWKYLGLLLLFLAINKQLDLQSWFAHVARQHALNHGWYEDRRVYQQGFIMVMAVLLPLFLVFFLQSLRERLRDFLPAMLGLTLLLAFVLVRASAFHHMDLLISKEFWGIRVNWILELGGILLLALGVRFRDQARHAEDEDDSFEGEFEFEDAFGLEDDYQSRSSGTS